MVSPSLSDADIATTISKVKTKFVESCGDYISSEFSFCKLCDNKAVQFILPFILIVISILLIKPSWAIDEEKKYKYAKILALSLIIYVFALLAIFGVRGYFCKKPE